jgi:phosphatidylglycerol:prolipoprotein diacylglycerol transferase
MADPIAFSIFGFSIYWYGLVYALGFLFTYWFVRLYAKEIGATKETLEDILFYGMLFGVLGGRLGHILFYQLDYFLMFPAEIIRVDRGGMSIHGGIIGGALAIMYQARKHKVNVLKFFDYLVIPLSLVMVFGRIANFVNQELVGRITTSSFGVNFSLVDDTLRHPSQLYESAKIMLTFQILLYLKYAKKLKPGIISAWFLILYNGLRFLVNFTREPEVYIGPIGMGQVLSLLFMVVGIVMLWQLSKRK